MRPKGTRDMTVQTQLKKMDERLVRIEDTLLQITAHAELKSVRETLAKQTIEMLAAMADGRKIEAIKILRQIGQLPLKEAKDYVCNAMVG